MINEWRIKGDNGKHYRILQAERGEYDDKGCESDYLMQRMKEDGTIFDDKQVLAVKGEYVIQQRYLYFFWKPLYTYEASPLVPIKPKRKLAKYEVFSDAIDALAQLFERS